MQDQPKAPDAPQKIAPPAGPGRRGAEQGPGIIFDSDMGRSIDTALALAMLYSLGPKGQLIAVSVSNSSLDAAAFCDAMARVYQGERAVGFARTSLPVGLAENGPNLGPVPMLSAPLAMKKPDGSAMFPQGIKDIRDTADPRVLIHNALLTQKDGEAIIVLAGPATNLVGTLAVKMRRDLTAAKVGLLVAALGAYPSGVADPRVTSDIKAARQLFADWPGPIVAVGSEVGKAVPYEGARIETDFSWAPAHPVVEAWRALQPRPSEVTGQATAAVLYAANQKEGYFKLSDPGTIEVLADGRTRFAPSANGKHRYLIADAEQKERVANAYTTLAGTKPTPPAGRGPRPERAVQAADPAKAVNP
jgi:hypothetical protein